MLISAIIHGFLTTILTFVLRISVNLNTRKYEHKRELDILLLFSCWPWVMSRGVYFFCPTRGVSNRERPGNKPSVCLLYVDACC